MFVLNLSRYLVDLANRLALRPKEAAQVLGISERSLREHLHRLPCVRFGSRRLLPVSALSRWVEEHSEIESERLDAAVEQTARELHL